MSALMINMKFHVEEYYEYSKKSQNIFVKIWRLL